MALFGLLGDGSDTTSPGNGLLGDLGSWLGDHSSSLMALGAGIAGGPNWGAGLSQGFQNASQYGVRNDMLLQQQRRKKAGEAALAKWAKANKSLTPEQAAVIQANPDLANSVFESSITPHNPSWGVIGKDPYGNEQYGWINPYDQSIKGGQGVGGGVSAGAGLDPAMPAGMDPREWRKTQTDRAAKEKLALDAGLQPGTEAYKNYMLGRQNRPLTSDQSNARGFAARMEQADAIISGTPTSPGVGGASSTMGQQAIDAIPDWMPGGSYAKSYLHSDTAKQEKQAKLNFITGILRKESGAAISDGEFAKYDQMLFPQPNDPPTVLAQKAQTRRQAIDNMKLAGSTSPADAVDERPNAGGPGGGPVTHVWTPDSGLQPVGQ